MSEQVPMNEAEVESVEMKPQETETSGSGTSETMVVEPPAPGDGVSSEEEYTPATKADVDACIDAVKELTKIIGEFQSEVMKKLTAGKF